MLFHQVGLVDRGRQQGGAVARGQQFRGDPLAERVGVAELRVVGHRAS